MSRTDKAALSHKGRPQRTGYRETPDVSAAVCRLVSALGRRTADGDPEDLAELLRVADAVTVAMRVAVAGLREAGRSDSEIGRVLGVSKQAVAQRWPRDGVALDGLAAEAYDAVGRISRRLAEADRLQGGVS